MSVSIDRTDLRERALAIGVTLNDSQLTQFERYAALLHEWNERLNLTTVPVSEYVERHFLDSLSLASLSRWNGEARVADIGSGAGFPAIPLKIAFPKLHLTIIESLQKRCNFLNEVATQLELTDVTILPERGEVAAHAPQLRESFDLVTARAVARLSVLSEYCLPLVKQGGYFIAMKGSKFVEEIAEGRTAVGILGGEIISAEEVKLPGLDDGRAIIRIRKIKKTPVKYPRKAGVPEKQPL